MGKSTTAQMFVDHGCVLWDADAVVHDLYRAGGEAVPYFARSMPNLVVDNAVSRQQIKRELSANPKMLKNIEAIVHPLVAKNRDMFRKKYVDRIGIFDIPLLFETQAEAEYDAVACVYVSKDKQRKRVLNRGTMSEEQFDFIVAKQIPIEEKLKRSDYHIHTETLEKARDQVKYIIDKIEKEIQDA